MKTRIVCTILAVLILTAWIGPLPAAAADGAAVLVSASPAETPPDRTSQLARLIRRARAGTTVTLSAGTYRLNGPLEIDKSITLVGAGMDETVIESVYGPSMVRFTGPGNLTLAGVTLAYVGEDGANVLVIDAGAVDIDGSRFTGGVWSAEDGLGGTGLVLWGDSVGTVSNSRFDGNGLHGIEIKEQAQLTVDGNVLTGNGENGIAFFDASSGDARNNDCSGNGLHGIGVAGEASVSIDGNTCNENGETGIRISGQATVEARGNETARNGLHGIVALESAQVTLEDNFVNENQESGIVFVDQATGDVRGNECSSNGLHGIGLEDEAQATIEDNQCLSNGEAGIIFFGEATGEVRNNECSFNLLHGIGVEGSGSPWVEGNLCEANEEVGIRVGGTSTSRVVDNVADGNQLHGIHVFDQAAPVLEGNVVRNNVEAGLIYFDQAGGVARGTECYGNNWGIYVEETANPTLEQNDCYDNTEADVDDRRQAEPSASPSPKPEGQLPPTGEILYADDFSNPSSGWDVGEWDEGKVWYGDRGLHLLNYTDSEYNTWSGANESFGDAVIEVDSQLVGGTDDNWQGVYCRRVDEDNYYYVAYSADGYASGHARVDGESVVSVDPERSAAINQGAGEINHLRLACVGDTVRFWVNDELVLEFTDDHLLAGDIALGASSLAGELSEVAFANLVVYAAEGAETAARPAAGAATATVRSAGLNVRAGPGLQYPPVVEARRGDELPVLGRNAACSWVQVDTPAGQGWVSSKYVDLSVDCEELPEIAAER